MTSKKRYISPPSTKKATFSDAVIVLIVKRKMIEQLNTLGGKFNFLEFVTEIQKDYKVSMNLCSLIYGEILREEAGRLRKQAAYSNSTWY